jgi:hypothetical protein
MQERKKGIATAVAAAAVIMMTATGAFAADVLSITAVEAADHIGEMAEVCGRVASTAHIAAVKGQPTFLNLEEPYPDQLFTVVIWGSTRTKFDGRPERMFDGKEICVSGRIDRYEGRPQIVVDDPSQIVVVETPVGGVKLSGTEKILMKALLASLGYDVNYGSGEWDEETREAMRAFQEGADVSPTGEPDAASLRALADAVTSIPDADRNLVIRLLLFELARRWE